jgi:Tol biopolymer transport system component
VAIIEASAFRIVDTTTDIALALPNGSGNPQFLSWNPDVNTNPPYQYVYDVATDLSVASLFQGVLYEVAGANDPAMAEMMPSWGSDGKIAYVRGMTTMNNNGGGSFGLAGPCDVMTIPVAGGTPTPLAGASNPTPGMGGAYYYPAYSPNGRWIAFTYSAQASSTIAAEDAVIRLARSDNSGTVMMLSNANNAPGNGATSYPTWSVNGAFLSFSSNRSGGQGDWDIYIAPVDPMTGVDGPATNVSAANSAAFEHAAIWSP